MQLITPLRILTCFADIVNLFQIYSLYDFHVWNFRFSFGPNVVPLLINELNKISDTFHFISGWK